MKHQFDRSASLAAICSVLATAITTILAAGSLTPHHVSGRCSPASSGTHQTIQVRVEGDSPDDPNVLPLVGVISGPDPCPNSPAPNLTPQLHDIGITTIRNNGYFDDRLDVEQIFQCPGGTTYPSWEGCDPDDDANYHWGPSDAQFQSFLNGGFEPFLRLGGEPQSDQRHHDFAGPQDAVQEDNWIQAGIRITRRYLYFNGQDPSFTYLDIWTEWPGAQFWDRSDAAFCSFWVRAFQALKERFPTVRIGGPGLSAAVTTSVLQGHGQTAIQFLTSLYHAGVHPDWLGWHLFTNHPERYALAATNYRHLLDGTGPFASVPWAGTGFFDGVELIADAWMISQYDDDGAGHVTALSREAFDRLANHSLGAAVDTASWITLEYTDVTKAYYYRCGDPRSDPGADPTDPSSNLGMSGLFYGDPAGTYKPRAHAVRLWSTIVRNYPHLLTTTLPVSTGPLWALAATDDHGDYAILLANTGDDVLFWQPFFTPPSGATTPPQATTLLQVDDLDDGRSPHEVANWPLQIPAASVQLVTFETSQQ